MLHLITGTPGSGKTLYAVSLLDKYRQENIKLLKEGKEPRQLYADIDGLEMEGVLAAPEDWRETPDGSVIFYDEIQQRESYKKNKADNPIVNDLQIHRHTGHDIYGITQFPVLLHNNFKAVVGLHYHLHRGFGLQASTVYQWAYCVDSPNTPSNKRLSEQDFRFSFPKKLFGVYKSATQHTHKVRIPKKLLAVILSIPILLFFVYKMLSGDSIITNVVDSASGKETTQIAAPQDDSTIQNLAPNVTQQPTSTTNTTNNVAPQAPDTSIYNPLTGGYYESANVAVSGAMMFNGECYAYNSKAQRVPLSNSDCQRYLSSFGNMAKKS